jgi:hypothetical protein
MERPASHKADDGQAFSLSSALTVVQVLAAAVSVMAALSIWRAERAIDTLQLEVSQATPAEARLRAAIDSMNNGVQARLDDVQSEIMGLRPQAGGGQLVSTWDAGVDVPMSSLLQPKTDGGRPFSWHMGRSMPSADAAFSSGIPSPNPAYERIDLGDGKVRYQRVR